MLQRRVWKSHMLNILAFHTPSLTQKLFTFDRRAKYFKSLSLCLHVDGDKSSQSYRIISSWKSPKESSRFFNVPFPSRPMIVEQISKTENTRQKIQRTIFTNDVQRDGPITLTTSPRIYWNDRNVFPFAMKAHHCYARTVSAFLSNILKFPKIPSRSVNERCWAKRNYYYRLAHARMIVFVNLTMRVRHYSEDSNLDLMTFINI
jgi:hypothetical protein